MFDNSAKVEALIKRAEDFHTRRRDSFPNIADPFPKVHRHTFHRTATQGKQFFYYYDPAACGSANPTYGTIIIKP